LLDPACDARKSSKKQPCIANKKKEAAQGHGMPEEAETVTGRGGFRRLNWSFYGRENRPKCAMW